MRFSNPSFRSEESKGPRNVQVRGPFEDYGQNDYLPLPLPRAAAAAVEGGTMLFDRKYTVMAP